MFLGNYILPLDQIGDHSRFAHQILGLPPTAPQVNYIMYTLLAFYTCPHSFWGPFVADGGGEEGVSSQQRFHYSCESLQCCLLSLACTPSTSSLMHFFFVLFKDSLLFWLGVMAHTCNSRLWEAEAGDFKFKTSLSYIENLSPNKNKFKPQQNTISAFWEPGKGSQS